VRLVLIRHGESEHLSRELVACNAGCTGLTERGFAQARALAERLRASGELGDCAALLSSPVLRARQTAAVLADVLPVAAVEEDCGLCELHPGEADGLTREDYRARSGAFDLPAFPDRPFAPGGESWNQVVARVRGTLDRLAKRYAGRTVVAVTHAGFIVVALLDFLDVPRTGPRARLDPRHASLTEWSVSDGLWRLECYNDTFHVPKP
jgi:broad specificity phosphatase PhoE